MSGDFCFGVFDLFAIDADGAVGDVFSGLAFGFFYAGFDEGFDDVDRSFCDFAAFCISEGAFDFIAGEFLDVAGEEGLGDFFCLSEAFVAVNEAGDFFSEFSLRISVFRMFSDFFFEVFDFFHGEEGEVLQVFHDIAVVLVEPELVEFVRACLLRIEPYGAACCLTEFRAVSLEHQRDGEAVSIGDAFGLSEEFYAVCDVAPLVSAADLQLYIVIVIEHLEVDGLEDLVREFRERNARIQSGCDDILGQHRVDIEKLAVIAEEVQKGNLGQPVIVVDHAETVFAEEILHLFFQAFCIMLDLFHRLEHTLGFSARRITNRSRAAADQDDRMMTSELETLHNHERNQMTDVHAVTGWIDAAIEGNRLLPYELVQALFIRLLVDSAAPLQFINNIHVGSPLKNVLVQGLPESYIKQYNTIGNHVTPRT